MNRLCILLTLIVTQVAFGKTVSNVAISPQGAVLQAGSSQQFTAVCTYSDSTTDNCSAAGGATWSSSLLTRMNVNSSGLATWVSDPGANRFNGGYVIVAAGGLTDKAGVYGQHPGDVWTTYITPDPSFFNAKFYNTPQPMNVTVGSTVALGYGFQINGDQNNPLQETCTWSSSNPSVATINRIGDVTGISPGTATFTCGRSGDAVYGTSSKDLWVSPGNLITLTVVNGGTGNQTWYVRPGGGLPYTNPTDTPNGQCDGKHDADYPGQGTNQPCALGNLRDLWSTEVGYAHLEWIISGGDTVIVRQKAEGYNVGGDAIGLPGNCLGNPNDCFMPTIPSGTAARHTRILGENYSNCNSDGLKTKLMGTFSGYTVINVRDSQFVDVQCFDISDRAAFGGGNFTISPQCPGGSVDCGTSFGILQSALTASTNYKDLLIHGMVEGIHGATGVGVNADHIHLRGNYIGGIDTDDSPFGLGNISVAGGLTLTYSTTEFTGCIEEYPVVHNYPYIECRDQNTGGYADGFGTGSTSGDWVFDHDLWFANFQDGLDLLHSGMHSLSVTNSQSIANDGQAFKIGSADNVVFKNNLALVNCARILHVFGDEPTTALIPGTAACRANGDGMVFSFTNQGSYEVQNNSFVGYNSTMFDNLCGGGWDYCQDASTVFQNNVVVGYASSLDGADGRLPGLFYASSDSMPANDGWAVRDHNFYYGVRYCPTPLQAGETCNTASPAFTGMPASFASPYSLDNFNFVPAETSPLVGAGVPLASILADLSGVLRPNPPAIGALEFSLTNTLNVSQVSVVVNPTTATLGQTVTITASVARVGLVAPTGTVTFTSAGVTLGSATLDVSGVATMSISSLPVGSYQVIATYLGDSGYTASASLASMLTVGESQTSKPLPQIMLALSSSTINAQQSVTFTTTVSTSGGATPTGTVTFYVGGTSLGQSALNGSGGASFSTSSLTAGTYTVTTSYSGDSVYASGTSNVSTLVVTGTNKTTAQLNLSLSATNIPSGQPLSFASAVIKVGGILPTGIITFYLNGSPMGQASLDNNGAAAIPVTLPAGTYTVTSSYSGDGFYASATSSPATLTVTGALKTITPITLGLSSSTITALQPVTVTANVTTVGGVTPTGTITFYLGAVSVGQVALNGGAATLSTSALTEGTYVVTASYSGDSIYSAGASNAASLTVNGVAKTTAQVTLGLSSNTISALKPVTFTTAVTTIGGVTPTGTITFYLGGIYLGQSVLNANGSTTLLTSSLIAGTYGVTASYSGDSGYSSGISNVSTLTVNPASKTTPQVSLTLSSSTIMVSQPVTLTASASTVAGVVPTGSVTFTAGGVILSTGALNGAGVATFTTSSLAAGTYAVSASYSGDTNYSSGVSNSASLAVRTAQTGVSITVGQPEFGFNVIPGSTRRIFATVTNGRTNEVIWTLKSGSGTLSSNAGSWIDVTAPAAGTSCSTSLVNGNYTVTSSTQFVVEATSVDDGTKTTDITVNVCNPTVQISVVPFYRTLYAKQPADIQSLIVGSVDQNVHWAITSKPQGGDGTLGDSTSRDTVFAASIPGRYTLTATSQADPSKTASAVVYVTGNTIPYAGPVTPNQTQPVDCTVDPAMAGTVYNVGPSQNFKTLASVPFPTLAAGSTVRIFNEDTTGINPTTYHEYVQLSQAGTATQPIRICGVPDTAGNQPILDGAGATGRSDTSTAIAGLGLLTLHNDTNTSVWPNFGGAAYIAVEGIHFRNAKTGYSYKAPGGSIGAWGISSACVRVNQGQNLAFVGNDFDGCGNGVYAAWNGTGGWGSSDLNVLWEGNHLHNNGVANSTSHQMYLEAWGDVVQFNRMDNYTAGGLGANLKSRGVQDVIRYNYFGDGPARQMDLVDVTNAPTYMSFSGFLHGGAASYHGMNPSDTYTADQLAAEQEAWNSHYAYGNIYQNGVSTAPIHFAMDTFGNEQARKGSLYWYNNTFNQLDCNGCQNQLLTMFDTSAGNGNFLPQTEFPTVQSFNNIIWLTNQSQTSFQWNNYDAFIGVSGANLITANWGSNNTTGGADTGWNATSNPTAYQGAENVGLHVNGFSQNLTTATTIPFSTVSWALTNDIQGNQGIPNAVCEMPSRFSYMPSLGYAIPRIAGPNMGATDTTPEAAAMMTTLVGPKQFNTHYSNCR